VFGVAVVVCGFAIQLLLSGHGAFVPPLDAPDFSVDEAARETADEAELAAQR
jgi:hypothetical protein